MTIFQYLRRLRHANRTSHFLSACVGATLARIASAFGTPFKSPRSLACNVERSFDAVWPTINQGRAYNSPHVLIGYRVQTDLSGSEFLQTTGSQGAIWDGPWGLLGASGWFDLTFPTGTTRARVHLQNFRATPVGVMIWVDDRILINRSVERGLTVVEVKRTADRVRLMYEAESWDPGKELGNGDTRKLSLHLESVSYG